VTTETGSPWVARPSRGRTIALAVLAAFAVAAIVVVGAVVWFDRSVDRVGVDGLGEGGLPAEGQEDDDEGEGEDEIDPSALTVLVLGSDSREVLTPEEQRELGTGNAEGDRTEVMALTRLDPSAEQVRVLSVPRDSLVTRCDGTEGRANAAYGIGERDEEGAGATCVVETLRDWLGVRIDHVVKVDFRGFVDIVDALGGVSMHLEEPLQDQRANLDLEAGCARLDGADALAFVRARHLDDDFGRMARQHRFVTELRDELAEKGVLSDLPQLLRVADATARAVELDDSLTLNRLQQLVRQHRDTISGEIDGRSIPGEIERIDGIAFLRVDEQRASELARWLVTGRDIADVRDDLLADKVPDAAGGDRSPGADTGTSETDTGTSETVLPETGATEGGPRTEGDPEDEPATAATPNRC
jgi:LCP family protein required for cell wall assembly